MSGKPRQVAPESGILTPHCLDRFTPLCLSFPIYKMGLVIVSTSWGWLEGLSELK